MFCCVIAACASAPPLVEQLEVVDEPPPTETVAQTPPMIETSAEDRVDLAPSKLTPWLESAAEFALAALRERPLPEPLFPLQQHALDGGLVALDEYVPDPLPPLRIIGAVLPELGLTLDGAPGIGRLEITLVLTLQGIRIADVRSHSQPRGCSPLPVDHPVHQVSQEVIEELREGRAEPLIMSVEACRELLNEARDCERIPVQVDESLAADLEALRVDLTTSRGPTSYNFEELLLIARGPAGEVYGLAMRFDCDDGQILLRGEPLVRVMPPR